MRLKGAVSTIDRYTGPAMRAVFTVSAFSFSTSFIDLTSAARLALSIVQRSRRTLGATASVTVLRVRLRFGCRAKDNDRAAATGRLASTSPQAHPARREFEA